MNHFDHQAGGPGSRSWRCRVLRAVFLILAGVGGCAKPAGVIFPPLATPLVWPAPPESPRIAYVGQLATNEDLKPAKPFFEGIAEAILGKKDIHRMLTPYAVCTDGADRVFVADSNAQFVHVFNLNNRRYDKWAPGEKDPILSQPVAVAWDPAGRLLVSDPVGGVIVAFDTNGKYMGRLGEGVLSRPCGIVVHPLTSRIYVADVGTHQIVVLSATGQEVVRLGKRGGETGEFNYPTNLAMDRQGRLYVSDSLNFRVQQILPDMKTTKVIGSKGDMPGYFAQPKGIAVDSQNHLYVVDNQFESVQIFDADGTLLLNFGEEGNGPGQFWLPSTIFVDPTDRIWVADTYNQRIAVFQYVRQTDTKKAPETQP